MFLNRRNLLLNKRQTRKFFFLCELQLSKIVCEVVGVNVSAYIATQYSHWQYIRRYPEVPRRIAREANVWRYGVHIAPSSQGDA